MVAVSAGDTLIISTYTLVGEEFVSEHAAKLHEFFIGLDWKGKWFMAGDFNEEYAGSWVATTAVLLGGEQGMVDCKSSRWSGDS